MEECYDEDREGTCAFWAAIRADGLHQDLFEAFHGNARFDRLPPYLVQGDEIEIVTERSRPSGNTLLLIFVDGEDNADFVPQAAAEPLYVGTFAAQMPVKEARPKKFDFCGVVRISHPDLPQDCLGYIAGISEDELGVRGYGVWVDVEGEVWSLDAGHRTSTGEFLREDERR